MRTHIKFASFFIVLASVFFTYSSTAFALTTCVGRPDATLNWNTANCTAFTASDGGIQTVASLLILLTKAVLEL